VGWIRAYFLVFLFVLAGAVTLVPDTADARCRWFKATHNGTDFFYSDGAAGTAEFKVKSMIDSWTAQRRIRRQRIYMASTKCGEWFIKYMLPHKHCIAKAKVCY
jgi:hypothetical protein